ncbi:MAG: hypothetical protein RR532_08355 [Erysipelothrix sp.]
MKKLLVLLLSSIMIVGCSTTPKVESTPTPEAIPTPKPTVEATPISSGEYNLKETYYLKKVYNTNFEKPQFAISDEDYALYNKIFDYISKYMDKTEAELYKELAPSYDMTAEQMSKFMNDNLKNVIDRDAGKTTGGLEVTETDLRTLGGTVLKEISKDAENIKYAIQAWTAEKTGNRVIVKGQFMYLDETHDVIIKYELSEDYQTAKVFQVKIDEINIDEFN